MQFVNDDMDDELFRQAAEEYPLRTDSADWNKVMDKMQLENTKSNARGNNGKKSRYLFLLALIPIVLVCTTYIKNNPSNINTLREIDNGLAVKHPSLQLKDVPETKAAAQEEKNVAQAPPSKNKKIKLFAAGNNSYTNINKEKNIYVKGTNITNKDFSRRLIKAKNNNEDELTVNSNKTTNLATDNNYNNGNKEQDNKQNIVAAVTDVEALSSGNNTPKKEVADQSKSAAPENPQKKADKTKRRGNKLYFGFEAGPDFSMVKSGKINGTGHSVGLLAGYNFNKKLAVESGVLWDHKKYQADGQYFKTEKLNWPHVTIFDLSGFCNMYEVPINLRYNLSVNSKRIWFANVGLSSYIMKKENYDYNYLWYGMYGKGNKEYKNSSTDWLSIAHLSFGVQKKLGNIGDLRVEPYVKLPVKGVGIGSMPLRSTGIYLGITRPIR